MTMKTHYRENPEKYANILTKSRIKCNCGHSIVIPACVDKVICSWCGNYVFKDKKTEFEYRINQEMRRNNEK